MAVINVDPFCIKHNSNEWIHYTPATNVYQCDACWDTQVERLLGYRQYNTPQEKLGKESYGNLHTSSI
jgi:hypothetical protein